MAGETQETKDKAKERKAKRKRTPVFDHDIFHNSWSLDMLNMFETIAEIMFSTDLIKVFVLTIHQISYRPLTDHMRSTAPFETAVKD